MTNPYRWQHDKPEHLVRRTERVELMARYLRDGRAIKLVGGRGMGKSVLLRQVSESFANEPDTRVVLVPSPPLDANVHALVHDLADRLGLASVNPASMDQIMGELESRGVYRLIVLLDEIDQYVLADDQGALVRRWLNHLEAHRKQWMDRFAIIVAGGLGLLHVAHVLGSGLVSRAEPIIAFPFDLYELRALADPFAGREMCIDDAVLQTLAVLSGGNPALATYGFGRMWDTGEASIDVLRRAFTDFSVLHRDFVKDVENAVSHRGLAKAPGQVLALVRREGGPLTQARLREACEGDGALVDGPQALQLLAAAGLVRVDSSLVDDPVHVHPVASILNLPALATSDVVDPFDSLIDKIAQILGSIHLFGRDFHGKNAILEEQVFSSMLAVALGPLGVQPRNAKREPVQAAGYPDLVVHLQGPALEGSVVLETKIWTREGYDGVQGQVYDYWVSDTVGGIVVMLGVRGVEGWDLDYEHICLNGHHFERMPPRPNIVANWRVSEQGAAGSMRATHHFLVQIPKRTKRTKR